VDCGHAGYIRKGGVNRLGVHSLKTKNTRRDNGRSVLQQSERAQNPKCRERKVVTTSLQQMGKNTKILGTDALERKRQARSRAYIPMARLRKIFGQARVREIASQEIMVTISCLERKTPVGSKDRTCHRKLAARGVDRNAGKNL